VSGVSASTVAKYVVAALPLCLFVRIVTRFFLADNGHWRLKEAEPWTFLCWMNACSLQSHEVDGPHEPQF